jgi:hypothetical protein
MEASIRCYVKGCDLCLRTKARQHAPFGLLVALDIPQERWKQVDILDYETADHAIRK